MDQLKIEPSSEERGVLEVYFDGELIQRVHVDIFGSNCSFKGQFYTPDSLRQWIQEKEREGAKRFLLKKIASKPLLKEQAKILLRERLVSEEVIADALADLERCFFFDDAYLIESKIAGKLKKHLGKDRVRMELWKEKIPEEVFEEAFQKVQKERGINPVSEALAFIKKTVKDPVLLEEAKERHRIKAKLFRRGFNSEVIASALKEFQIEDDDSFPE
ncbi:regulatory protein RecX [Estrella lausannensis]|uniref:Regulatory protein RecX n=1 Tax=Estrella lausannensis TaxID=483423 RepID=A0A0H5DNC2_9BACT|nr:regulatory protein RecX [Estrella lausannensis]CRX37796.1 regulatory protein RecX [Estrella lausannensis]